MWFPDSVQFLFFSLTKHTFHTLAQTIITQKCTLLATACSILHGYSQCERKGKAKQKKKDMNNEKSAT